MLFNRSTKQFLKELRRARLTRHDWLSVRNHVASYIQENPAYATNNDHVFVERRFRISLMILSRPLVICLLLVVLVLFGGGVTYAAEQAIPGDMLYPIKIRVNEEIRAALSISAEAKTNWELARIGRRLDETERLISANRLGAQEAAHLQAEIEQRSNKVRAGIASFTSSARLEVAADVTSNFEATLRAHGRLVASIAGSSNDGIEMREGAQKIVSQLQTQVASSTDALTKISREVEERTVPDAKSSAAVKKSAAQRKLNEIKQLYTRIQPNTADESRAHIESQINEATKLMNDAETQMKEGSYGEAFRLFQRAHSEAQEVKVFAGAQKKLKIDSSNRPRASEDTSNTNTNSGGQGGNSQGGAR